MSETELRKCPFCGGEAKIVKSFYSIWVKCTCCNASTNGGESEEIAAELWNRRAGEQKVIDEMIINSIACRADDESYIMLDKAIEIVEKGGIE